MNAPGLARAAVTSGAVWASAGLAGAAIWVTMTPRLVRRDVLRMPGPARAAPVTGSHAARRAAALLVAVGVATVVGGAAGVLVGAVSGWLAARWLGTLARPAPPVPDDVPLALDLLGEALAAGSPLDSALVAVAGRDGAPSAVVFRSVAASLRLGGSAAEAWQPAMEIPALAPVARSAVRGAASGARLAELCHARAADLRAQRSHEMRLRAKRAGVLAVLPLTGCFLPAFVLLAVVPFIAGLIASLRT